MSVKFVRVRCLEVSRTKTSFRLTLEIYKQAQACVECHLSLITVILSLLLNYPFVHKHYTELFVYVIFHVL